MASETQSWEIFLPDIVSEKNGKTVIFTKKKLTFLILVAILILGIVIIPVCVHFEHLKQEKIVLTKNLTRTMSDIAEMKTNEKELKEKMDSKNSFANFLKVENFGYFQKLEDKMSYFDGQDACHKIHGKIIESDERYGTATKKLHHVGFRLNLSKKWRTKGEWFHKDYTSVTPNYGHGFDVPFYMGLINIGAHRDKNLWKWSSTGRYMTNNTLGIKEYWDGREPNGYRSYKQFDWKLISWAKGQMNTTKKLRGDCAFVNRDAELKEIDCATKLTIICEEL